MSPPLPPKNYKISSAFSYNFISALTPMIDRAAQFQPFRALIGYENAVQETARLTDAKPELTEEEKAFLDLRLRELDERIASLPSVTLTYFQPDKRKAGGAYVTVTGQLKRIDHQESVLMLVGGEHILIENILSIQMAET